jgi:DNA mismatch repair ATPase MutS
MISFHGDNSKQRTSLDYKIQDGHLITRNAIKILELADYPADVIEEVRNASSTCIQPPLNS